jgi:hypothetical protein
MRFLNYFKSNIPNTCLLDAKFYQKELMDKLITESRILHIVRKKGLGHYVLLWVESTGLMMAWDRIDGARGIGFKGFDSDPSIMAKDALIKEGSDVVQSASYFP